MKTLILALFGSALATAAFAGGHAKEEKIAKINDMLAEMSCEIDEDDIEFEDDGGFDLDDVQCSDGQYDIKLDKDYKVVGKRKE
jgi:hypothetical protein